MKGIKQLKSGFADPKMKELIETLWREYYGLYVEKYDRDPEKWLLNQFSDEIDFGQAMGMDHIVQGDQSLAMGIGQITTAFREVILGSYATTDDNATPDEWKAIDRLLTVGKGITKETRADALIIFKSGLMKVLNAMQICKYDHRTAAGELVEPQSGTLQYTPEKQLELYVVDRWVQVKDKNYHHEQINPSRVWEIAHNLEKYPSVTIFDFSGAEVEAEVSHTDTNNLIVTFSVPFAGYADLN
jgi:hypothetical protein